MGKERRINDIDITINIFNCRLWYGSYIKFEINVIFDKLLSLMKKSKVYFYPSHGKHFGILIVEAMSEGLIPIVAYEWGQTELFSKKNTNTLH